MFVTCDRYLARYARYRNVNVLLFEYDDKPRKDQAGVKFVQYSLAMSRHRVC